MADDVQVYDGDIPFDAGGTDLRNWLARTPETAIDPDQPIIDPHHHLWDRRPRPDLPAGTRTHLRYLADDLLADIRGGGHRVVDTVFIECGAMYGADPADPLRPVGETRFVDGVAAMAASGLYGDDVRMCGGIVGFTNLMEVDHAESVLKAHMAASTNFRGIRHAHGWHASPEIRNSHHPTRDIEGLLAKPEFRQSFRYLDDLQLTFDCWGFHTQLAEVADLAAAFPGVTIVVNHIGGPMAYGPYAGQRKTTVFDDWSAGIARLAGLDNVYIKLGGCGMPTYGFDFHEGDDGPPASDGLASAWRPYFQLLIERFGPDHCMFESNFPVDKVSCSYTSLWNAFKVIANELSLSQGDKDRLFHATAAEAYSLDVAV